MSKKRSAEDIDHADLSNEEILKIVEEIISDPMSEKEKIIEYGKKYPEFSKRHEMLFEVVCRPNFDLARLKYMMSLRSQIQNNSTTVETASNRVGLQLFNQYVKPIVDANPPKP